MLTRALSTECGKELMSEIENIKGKDMKWRKPVDFAHKGTEKGGRKLEGEGSSRKSLERREKFQYVLVDSIQEKKETMMQEKGE